MGATIRALRKEAGLSQVALGVRSGMHHNYASAIERGSVPNPRIGTVARIARGLGVSIGVLAASYARPSAAGACDAAATAGRGCDLAGIGGPRALGEAIRLVRGLRGLTQTQLADAAGLQRSQLVILEVGQRRDPGIGTVASVARGLEIGDDEPPLLPLLAQIFAGEITAGDLRPRLVTKPSESAARPVPQGGRHP